MNATSNHTATTATPGLRHLLSSIHLTFGLLWIADRSIRAMRVPERVRYRRRHVHCHDRKYRIAMRVGIPIDILELENNHASYR
ncbi:MAG: hypothetical protein K2Y35_11795 [Burkholderiales bacterium]|nr:hypothetical protein [Burkholderiales bacterium]